MEDEGRLSFDFLLGGSCLCKRRDGGLGASRGGRKWMAINTEPMRIKSHYYKRLCRELAEFKIHKLAIIDAKERLKELNPDIDTGVSGIDYSKDVVVSTSTGSPVEHIVISRMELQAYYQHIIDYRSESYKWWMPIMSLLLDIPGTRRR